MRWTHGLVVAALTAMLGLGASGAENSLKTEKRLVFTANAEWKVVDLSDVQVKKGSALDLSSISEPGPAGKHGRLMVSKSGTLAFEDSPDVPRRLLGFNGLWITTTVLGEKALHNPDKEFLNKSIVKLAELIKRQGYDIVRPLVTDGYLMQGASADCEFNPDKLDNIDRLVAELKANGVYTYLTIAAYCVGRADVKKAFAERNEDKTRMYLGDPATRARWKVIAEKMLSHVNPYTGIAWKDEPAIACVEFYNEQEIGRLPAQISKVPQGTRDLISLQWRAWLLEKYQTTAAVASAWGEQGLSVPGAFEKLEIPKENNSSGPKADDFGLFFRSLARAEMAWCEGIVRGAGYKGLISQFNFSKQILDSAIRWETSELTSMNAYTGGATNGSRPGSKCWQGGSTQQAANYWRYANATRLSDRPLLVTETHHYFWNRYQHEEGLVFAPYAALQGFAAIMAHEDPVALEVSDLTQPYVDWLARNPVARANEFIAACLFRRGDVKKATHRVELQIPSPYLNDNGNQTVNTEQDKIGLMTRFSIAFPELKRPAILKSAIPKPDVSILPDSGAETRDGDSSSSVVDSQDSKFSLPGFVSKMKAKGILPASNLSNPDAGVFQSETGEITLRTREKLIKVVTPRTEGVSLMADKAEALSCLSVEGSSVPAAIAAIAIDENPLASSARIVLVYNTEMAFTGMELSEEDRVTKFSTMYQQGKMPVLMRAGKLKATLKCKAASKMALYALRIDGTRREKLPVSVEGAALKIVIDTAALKDGATPFFELVAE